MNPSTDLHRLGVGPVIPVSDLPPSIAFYHDVLTDPVQVTDAIRFTDHNPEEKP